MYVSQKMKNIIEKSIHLHASPGTFALDEQLWQFFNIHSSQCRATKIRLHIRHGKDAPIAVCGLVGKVVFEQRSRHTERHLGRCYFRKPLFPVRRSVGQILSAMRQAPVHRQSHHQNRGSGRLSCLPRRSVSETE